MASKEEMSLPLMLMLKASRLGRDESSSEKLREMVCPSLEVEEAVRTGA